MNTFTIINDDNSKSEYEILHSFRKNDNNYIIYTDNSVNENDELNVLANKYIIENNNIRLLEIDDNEWDIIDNEWNEIYE